MIFTASYLTHLNSHPLAMSAISFEHHIIKYEVDNHCILLRDDAKTDYSNHISGNTVVVTATSHTYTATVNEYYVDGKFQAGMHFDGKDQSEKRFMMEQSVMAGHICKVTFQKDAALIDGAFPVQVEITVKTRK